ncbi:ATP-binding cassette domain-containing protein [Actinomyces sp.]|uniref:ABC transporter ATP-binding protein n=1 Tax=Actinomyces sp. TaxID=29317 RepID=UPI0026DB73DA|nr:ATP-binding cassette domain-containing protein [Actinomyces sp.]MDO4899761.1 ATP-binding cassette domain-containing protein [Actinomyces sp.]
MVTSAIKATNLSKTYRIQERGDGLLGSLTTMFHRSFSEIEAVSDLSLEIAPGEFVGFLGPNGAGKSTTIKMLTGVLRPDVGEVMVHGVSPSKDRILNARQIGVVFGQRSQLNWDVPVRESLRLVGAIYGLSRNDAEARIDEMTTDLDLGELLSLPTRQLSLGQKMRCELAASLLHRPKVVFLDEPTIGLDVTVKATIRSYLQQINVQDGTTILLTTHDMGDVEALCKRLVVIDDGRTVFDGDIDRLKSAITPFRTVEFTFDEGWPIDRNIELPETAHIANIDERHLVVEFDPEATTNGRVISAVTSVMEVDDVSVGDPDVESIIGQIYAGGLK